MSQIQTFILAFGGLQGFLLFVLLVSDRRVNYASKLLGVYCLLLAATLVLPLIVAEGESDLSWLIGPVLFLPAGYGALSYLYGRSAMTGSPLKRSDLIHFLPLFVCYALNYQIIFSAEKALEFVRMPKESLMLFKLTLLIFYGHALIYAVLLIRLIYHYQLKAKRNLSSYNPDTFKWHWTLALFMVSIWALKALVLVIGHEALVNFVADSSLVLLVYFFAIAQWRNPSLFHVQQLLSQLQKPAPQETKLAPEGLLDRDMRSSVLSTVQQRVEEQALYRDSNLTLATLAEEVGVSVHHLSEALNQQGGKNFNRFINEYRVAEVCQHLDHKSERKLIDLALDAGFSSKSSFNATFKKLTGQTPSVYRAELGRS